MDVEQPALDRVDPVAGLVTVGLRRNRLELDLGSLRIVAGNDDVHRVHGRRDYGRARRGELHVPTHRSRTSAAIAASTPLTKRPESSVE